MNFRAWRNYLLPVLFLAIVLIAGCRGCNSDSETTTYGIPGVKPTVESVLPANGAVNIALNSNITATFSKPMATTNASTTFLLKTGGVETAGIVIYEGLIGQFDPNAILAASTLYTATINTGAKDAENNSMLEDFSWSFTTGLAIDSIRPTVVSTNPANGATGVPTNKVISVPFSEEMDPLTVNSKTFVLTGPLGAISGQITCTGVTAVFSPSSPLVEGAIYNGTITSGVKDVAGNNMLVDYLWSFTGVAPEKIRPTIVSTDPSSNETGVGTNKKVSILFSEEMNPLTIKSSTFIVKNSTGTAIPGLVTYAGLSAIFTPTAALANGGVYTATVTTDAKDLAGNSLAANYVWSFTTGIAPDSAAPSVVSTDPDNNTVNVAINQRIAATFNEGMDAASINTTSFTVKKADGTPVSGSVNFGGLISTFSPNGNLEFNTIYTATISVAAKDLADNHMKTDYVWSFTTGAVVDSISPTIVTTDPANFATDVAINKKVAVTFSETMNPATLHAGTFTITGPALSSVAGTVTYSNLIAIFSPETSLLNNTTYTGTITSGAKDLAGNALITYSWTFTTGAAADNTPPLVISTDPASKGQNVAINKSISINFSETMNSTTVNASTFTLAKLDGTPVSGGVSYSGLQAIFNPVADMASNATYTAKISTGAKDLANNALAADYIWEFHTGVAADIIAPTVSNTDPTDNASDIPINKIVAVTFSENMDATTIKTSTFTVSKPDGTTITGTVTYSGKTANFTPNIAMATNALHTARVTTGVKDLAGNPMNTNYTWRFTTSNAADTIVPTVVSTDPAANSTNVAFNKTLSVSFSETMNSASINNTTFSVKKQIDGSDVAGVVSYDGLTGYFNPNSNLAADATYTASLTSGAKDLAGNPLTSKTWIFTTGLAPDVASPLVLSSSPAANTINVAVTSKVSVSFNEAMDSGTLNTTSFKLTKLGGADVGGTVSYSGLIATFTPSSSLAFNSTYTATITTVAEDLAGNPLATNFVWSFKTAAAPDNTPPTITISDPVDKETDVAFDKTIAVSFSESMISSSITTNFTLQKLGALLPVAGVVSYTGLTAKFNPDVNLDPAATYTATIKSGSTGVKDLAGNALAADYSWSFRTGAAPDTLKPTVISTVPANGLTDVPVNQLIKATFSEGIDPDTIDTQSFKIAGLTGIVSYDAITRTATFKSDANMAISTPYTVTIASSVKDLAGNSLDGNTVTEDHVWSFTTGIRTLAEPVALGNAAPFGNFGGSAGMTNQGLLTVVNGDIGTTGASTLITGFHDGGGNVYTETPMNAGLVTGLIHTATAPPGSTPGSIAAAGALDTNTAYINLSPAALPGGIDVSAYGGGAGDLGNRVLKPGIYQSAPGSFKIQGGPLTLDAQGDANAVWVFQMASTLTVGGPGAAFPQNVILVNGAQAKNVFWQVGSAATINAGGGGTMVGTIIAQAGVTFSTPGNLSVVTLNGRALSLGASVTLVNTVINVPAN